MRNNRKALVLLLIVCLLIFLSVSRNLRKKEVESEPDKEKQEHRVFRTEIIVYNTRNKVIEKMDLDEYIVGVVAAEMPASFEMEALKAQAVAARTYALGRALGKYGSGAERHYGAHVCTDSTHCQAWITKEMYRSWYPNSSVEESWAKIEEAVYSTSGLILTYEGEIINPLYHANSGGITEDIQEVWSSVSEVPYLKSVYSEGESDYSSYEKKVVLTGEEVREKLMKAYPEIVFLGPVSEDVEVVQHTNSQRVKEIRIGSITIPGTKFREMFSLASTIMEINFIEEDVMEVTTYGFGHGVGMSQCGANELAQKGRDYEYILKYYYTGVEVETISEETAAALNGA